MVPGLTQALDDAAGHRAHVRAPVSADVRFVARATQRDAHVLAAQRARDRLRDRRLADAGRTDEEQDRAATDGDSLGASPDWFPAHWDRAWLQPAHSPDVLIDFGFRPSSGLLPPLPSPDASAALLPPRLPRAARSICSLRTARNSSTRSFTSSRP